MKSRPMLLLERTMYRDGRTPFTTVFTVQIAGELDEARLLHALACVQSKHPLTKVVVGRRSDAPQVAQRDHAKPSEAHSSGESGVLRAGFFEEAPAKE